MSDDFFGNASAAATEAEGTEGIDNLVIDLDDIDEDASFPVLPKGTYEAVVKDVDLGKSKKGDPMVTWQFTVFSDELENGKITLRFYNVMNQALGKAGFKKAIMATGAELPKPLNVQALCDNGDLIGLPVQVVLGIGKYEGRKNNNIKEVKEPASQEFLG